MLGLFTPLCIDFILGHWSIPFLVKLPLTKAKAGSFKCTVNIALTNCIFSFYLLTCKRKETVSGKFEQANQGCILHLPPTAFWKARHNISRLLTSIRDTEPSAHILRLFKPTQWKWYSQPKRELKLVYWIWTSWSQRRSKHLTAWQLRNSFHICSL